MRDLVVQMALDNRVIKAPKDFTGKDEDWAPFKFKFRNYLTLLDAGYDIFLDAAEENQDEIAQESLTAAAQGLSIQLYALLAQLCQEKALKLG